MTDLEMTRLCAEAMELSPIKGATGRCDGVFIGDDPHMFAYRPLVYDAQAMALLKRFQASIRPPYHSAQNAWDVIVATDDEENGAAYRGFALNLNRAVVEAVAQMQRATVPGGGQDAGSVPEQDKHNAVVQSEPEGWVSVPLEPTEQMLDAGGQAMFMDVKRKTYCDIVRRGWKAMLAAR